MQGAVRPRALLPALAFALICAHLPADVLAGERAASTVLGIWGDYQPAATTKWVPVSLLSFAKDSGNAGGGSSGNRQDDKDKKEKKDKKKEKDKDKDKKKDKCKDKHKEKHKDKCKKKDKDEADDNDDDEEASDEQEDGDGQVVEGADADPGVSPAVVASGTELTISGTSAATIVALDRYSFRPTTAGGAGDSVLAFSISGEPLWAVFNELTGELSGTPGEADVGLYQAITISVTDGGSSASLAPFSIEVTAIGTATGSVTLNWIPPTENEDGTPLMDLAGYRVYWGEFPGTHTEVMDFDNPGLSRVVIDNLAPGSYEFVATAINDAGVESRFSNAITRVVQ
jgi:hypothetical protein